MLVFLKILRYLYFQTGDGEKKRAQNSAQALSLNYFEKKFVLKNVRLNIIMSQRVK